MFASIRKMSCQKPAPIDDYESLLYLIAFCLDDFNLPWLPDYIHHDKTVNFVNLRL